MNFRSLLVVVLTLTSLSTQAKQRFFEVELLIFQRNVELPEQLSSQPTNLEMTNSISLLKTTQNSVCIAGEICLSEKNPTVITEAIFDANGNNFKYLSSSHLKLVEERQRLEEHANFKPIFHMAWLMPVTDPIESKPIHIFAGENLAFNIQKRQLKTASLNKDSDALTEATSVLTDQWEIDGNFKVYLDDFLYIDSQLVIRKEVTGKIAKPKTIELIDDKNGVQIALQSKETEVEYETVIKEMLFDQTQRLRSGEIHYFDNPLIGMLVQIREM